MDEEIQKLVEEWTNLLEKSKELVAKLKVIKRWEEERKVQEKRNETRESQNKAIDNTGGEKDETITQTDKESSRGERSGADLPKGEQKSRSEKRKVQARVQDKKYKWVNRHNRGRGDRAGWGRSWREWDLGGQGGGNIYIFNA